MTWTDLCAAGAVAPGSALAVDVGELELVVWRTSAGHLVVSEARCPHQWSHLAIAGAVDGEELVCLSHFWRFDAEGHGCKLGMTGRRDPKSDVRVFTSREVGGRIEAVLD